MIDDIRARKYAEDDVNNILDVLIGDNTGCIVLELWDAQIKKFGTELEAYDVIDIVDAYIIEYGGLRIRLSSNGFMKLIQKSQKP